MLIQKTFHVHQPLNETRNRLNTIGSYRRQLDGVGKAIITAEGGAHFRFEPGLGYSICVDLVEVPNENPECMLFKSTGGNIRMAGMIEYFSIRENLTEIVLTLDYQLKSPLARVADAVGGVMDRFLNTQLRRVQAHFEGVGTFAHHSPRPMQTIALRHSAA